METSGEDEMVCPWCDTENPDSWEYQDAEGNVHCDFCLKPFTYCRHTEVTYSTSRPLEGKEIDKAEQMIIESRFLTASEAEMFRKDLRK